MNLVAWNCGVLLAGLALMAWWRADGARWWQLRGQRCSDCGRDKANCSCIDVIFTPWDEEDE